MFKKPRPRSSIAGFTVIEILLTLSLLGVLGTMTLQTFHGWLPRMDLRAANQQCRALITKARLEAIQRGVTTVVEVDLVEATLTAYADVNGDPMAGAPGYANYLRLDPDPALGEKQTDYLIGQLKLDRTILGTDTFAAVDGFTSVPGAPVGTPEVLVFSASGVPDSIGAFRLADATSRNVLEVAVASLAGKVESRKYLRSKDAPSSNAGFFPNGADANGQNVWVWY